MKRINAWGAILLALTVVAGSSSQPAIAQNRTDWTGTADVELAYNQGDTGSGQGTNWSSGFQPDATFSGGEYGSISNGGIAVIDGTVAPFSNPVTPADLRLGEDGGTTGSLVIRNGGSITVAPGSSGSGLLANGGAGSGTLVLSDDLGAVSVEAYSQNASSTLVTQLSSSSSFSTPVSVTNSITLGGTLQVNQTPGSGFTLTAGDSWTVFSGASVFGDFSSVEVDPALQSNPGQSFAVSTSGNAVTMSVDQRLILEVDRFTGAAVLRNPSGHTIDIEFFNYTLSSPNNGVSMSNSRWSSFEDDGSKPGWFEANPTATDLSELNPLGFLTMSSGDSHDFGTPVNANASAPLGTDPVDASDVSFSYQDPSGNLTNAVVTPVGRINDLVLVVDPNSGNAFIQNQSKQSIEIISYTISSGSGALDPNSFTGLEGLAEPNWEVANPTLFDISELNSIDSTLISVGDDFDLGISWDPNGARDLTFTYQLTNGVLMPGTVDYGALAVVSNENADFNSDGLVDGVDFLAFQRGFGSGTTLAEGDANDDMVVNSADLAIWESQYGSQPIVGAIGVVPEPSAVALCLVASAVLSRFRARGSI